MGEWQLHTRARVQLAAPGRSDVGEEHSAFVELAGRDLERVSVQNRQVRQLPCFERPRLLIEVVDEG